MSFLFALCVIPFLIGLSVFLCFRTKKTAHRVVLVCAVLAGLFVAYAATNPIPGNEGPGLLAWMYVCLTLGAAVGLFVGRILPKPLPLPRTPAFVMSGWLLATFGVSAVATFPVAILCGSSYEGASISVAVVIPLLWGFAGWLMPQTAHPKKLWVTIFLLLLWGILPAGLIFWSAASDSIYATYFSILTLSHRTIAPLLYASLFYSPQSAFALDVLRPLAVASIHAILTVCFAVGMLVRKQKTS